MGITSLMSANYYRGSRTLGGFAKAALLLCPSGFLVSLQAPSSPSCHPPPPTNRHRLLTKQQSCLTLLAGDGLAPESWLEGNAEAHISLARAKRYSDVAFQTDTNCSSNKHRRANPRTFITVRKDERKDSHKRPLRAGLVWLAQGEVVRSACTPGVFSLVGLKPGTKTLGFAFIVIHKACVGAYPSRGEQGEKSTWVRYFCGQTDLTTSCQWSCGIIAGCKDFLYFFHHAHTQCPQVIL